MHRAAKEAGLVISHSLLLLMLLLLGARRTLLLLLLLLLLGVCSGSSFHVLAVRFCYNPYIRCAESSKKSSIHSSFDSDT